MSKEPDEDAIAFIALVEQTTGLSGGDLIDRLAREPGMSATKALGYWKWKRGENAPSFRNVMALLYAAGMIKRPQLGEQAAEKAFERAGSELGVPQVSRRRQSRGRRPA